MSSDQPAAEPIELVVSGDEQGVRLDVFLAARFPAYSRVFLRRAISAQGVTVDGQRVKVAYRLHGGQCVRVALPAPPRGGSEPEDIPLDILYEDEHLAAINKPPGMVVHPARGHWRGTLAAALQFHFDRLSAAGGPTRPGIVHRLDRDTSGVVVVAKNDAAHYALAAQFENRTIQKEYFAVVVGRLQLDRDVIRQPIGIHPQQREKMAVRRHHAAARQAETFYEVVERFDGFAALRVAPKTGRTHQIRVHLDSIGAPVLCDRLYGGRAQITLGEISRQADDDTVLLARQALHAHRLTILHPRSGEMQTFESPIPDDIAAVLTALRRYREQ